MEGRSGAAPELPPDPTMTPAEQNTQWYKWLQLELFDLLFVLISQWDVLSQEGCRNIGTW